MKAYKDYLLVRRAEPEEVKTESGIVLTSTRNRDGNALALRVEVVDIGSEVSKDLKNAKYLFVNKIKSLVAEGEEGKEDNLYFINEEAVVGYE